VEKPSAIVPGSPLRSIGQEIDRVRTRFAESGALGMVVIDAMSLEEIERFYGVDAHRQVTGRIAARAHEVLSEHLEPGDLVLLGELGRDELIVLLFRDRRNDGFYHAELPGLARTLLESLSNAGSRFGYPFTRETLRFSVGAALALYDPTLRPELLIRRARRQALRDADLNARIEERQRREELVSLILAEQVSMVFEPIVKLTTREVLGYEALARGTGSASLASPKDLFAAAAEMDLLFELDCLCRRQAIRQTKHLPEGSKLFLNLLPCAIYDPAFEGDALRRTLQDQRLHPSDVVFEISERESIGNFAIFRELCDRYSELGFEIAIDDVGAGYGSLEAVTELAPDYIKVDIAFIRGIDSDPARQGVIVALNEIARRIGAQIVAEGIETPEQLETLKKLGVPYGQGYFIGRAAPLDLAEGGSANAVPG
jgi:EAL domain-containing protein (putative c-di-GMP-specific phosphodiesterase class I)